MSEKKLSEELRESPLEPSGEQLDRWADRAAALEAKLKNVQKEVYDYFKDLAEAKAGWEANSYALSELQMRYDALETRLQLECARRIAIEDKPIFDALSKPRYEDLEKELAEATAQIVRLVKERDEIRAEYFRREKLFERMSAEQKDCTPTKVVTFVGPQLVYSYKCWEMWVNAVGTEYAVTEFGTIVQRSHKECEALRDRVLAAQGGIDTPTCPYCGNPVEEPFEPTISDGGHENV